MIRQYISQLVVVSIFVCGTLLTSVLAAEELPEYPHLAGKPLSGKVLEVSGTTILVMDRLCTVVEGDVPSVGSIVYAKLADSVTPQQCDIRVLEIEEHLAAGAGNQAVDRPDGYMRDSAGVYSEIISASSTEGAE